MPGEGRVGYRYKFLLRKSDNAPAQAAQGGRGGSPLLEAFENCGDVALRDTISGHSACDLGILEVFGNLNNSVIL